ncbi:MAG: ABC transporter permease [Oscillospiraceae bacterium]|nr:ABC transporter permease [Oscillospiraceae bacterium]
MRKNNQIPDIPSEKFAFVGLDAKIHDQKFETKQVSFFRDALHRFCKNKSSVVAAIIILSLVLYAIFIPVFCSTNYSLALTDTNYLNYVKMAPKNEFFAQFGIWDGSKELTLGEANLAYVRAIGVETNTEVIKEVKSQITDEKGKVAYICDVDTYIHNGFTTMTLSADEYQKIQQWQNETGVQVIYPAVNDKSISDANIWYEATRKGAPKLDADGNYVNIYKTSGEDGSYNSLRVAGDPGIDDPEAAGRYRYATITGDSSSVSYKCRIFKYSYFQYRYGFEPAFAFGTNALGQDILTRLAAGARFSLLFALCIACINLFIGAVYGAIEGYYGGAVDMLMERFSDILSRVPFLVVATLFQLHLAKKVGPVPSLLFAFVLTGWIGMASTVRMQFYRFKGQEYVLASRTLGAKDMRIMFKHIFPNALGTIVTSSVLVIPGVIFQESSLTYLGIVNLDSSTMTSVGTMLANGRQYLSSDPHIILFPALFISLLMISFNLFGNGLRDAFNPALRGSDE